MKLYVLAWVDIDLMNADGLAAPTTLELALKDRYGHKVPGENLSLGRPVQYMVEDDGLTDERLPMAAKNGWSIVAGLYETNETRKKRKGTGVMPSLTLAEIRNLAAHGLTVINHHGDEAMPVIVAQARHDGFADHSKEGRGCRPASA